MLPAGGHLGSDDFKKFISVFPCYSYYIPTISEKSIQGFIRYCRRENVTDGRTYGRMDRRTDGLTDRTKPYMPPAYWA